MLRRLHISKVEIYIWLKYHVWDLICYENIIIINSYRVSLNYLLHGYPNDGALLLATQLMSLLLLTILAYLILGWHMQAKYEICKQSILVTTTVAEYLPIFRWYCSKCFEPEIETCVLSLFLAFYCTVILIIFYITCCLS